MKLTRPTTIVLALPLCAAASLARSPQPQAAATPDVTARVRQLAAELETLSSRALIYRVRDEALPGACLPSDLVALMDEGVEASVFEALLADGDPRVRTLAVALAYDAATRAGGDWRGLGALDAMVGDDEPGIPSMDETFFASSGSAIEPTPGEPFFDISPAERTVGELARQCLEFCIQSAGSHERFGADAVLFDAPGASRTRRWRLLRAARGEARVTSGTCTVALVRATQGMAVMDDAAMSDAATVIDGLDDLPPARRASALIALYETLPIEVLQEMTLTHRGESVTEWIERSVEEIGPGPIGALFTPGPAAGRLSDPDRGPAALQRYLLLSGSVEPAHLPTLRAWGRAIADGKGTPTPVEVTVALAGMMEPEEARVLVREELQRWLSVPLAEHQPESGEQAEPAASDEEIRRSRYGLAFEVARAIQDDADLGLLVDFVGADPTQTRPSSVSPAGILLEFGDRYPQFLRYLAEAIVTDPRYEELGPRTPRGPGRGPRPLRGGGPVRGGLRGALRVPDHERHVPGPRSRGGHPHRRERARHPRRVEAGGLIAGGPVYGDPRSSRDSPSHSRRTRVQGVSERPPNDTP